MGVDLTPPAGRVGRGPGGPAVGSERQRLSTTHSGRHGGGRRDQATGAQQPPATLLQATQHPQLYPVLCDVIAHTIRELTSEVLPSKDKEAATLISEVNANKTVTNQIDIPSDVFEHQ